MTELFTKHNKFLIVHKNDNISELNNYKNNFIISQKIKNKNDLESIFNLSNYATNIKFLNCTYNEMITNKIADLSKNIYDNI